MNLLTSLLAQGTLTNRPAATIYNAGYYYLATDVNGGTLYQSTGTAWVQLAPGVSQPSGPNVSDGTTTVTTATQINIAGGPTVSSGGAGIANLEIRLHVHAIGEQMTGDGATITFYLAQEAEQYSVAAYVAGSRTDVTQSADGAKITFASAPAAAAAIRVDYLAVLSGT